MENTQPSISEGQPTQSTEPEIPQASETPAPLSQTHIFKNKLSIFGLVLMACAIGLSGYYVGTLKNSDNTLKEVDVLLPADTTLTDSAVSVPLQTSTVDDSNWQTYTDELEGYQFKFAANHILSYIPTSEGGHRYGVFENQDDSAQCLDGLPMLSDECYQAYYFVLISSSDETPSNLNNGEKYIDAKGREWILLSNKMTNTFRVEGFLKENSSWQKVLLESPLIQEESPALLSETTEIAKLTLSSFENRF